MSDLGDLLSGLSAHMEEGKDDQFLGLGVDEIQYPIEVEEIKLLEPRMGLPSLLGAKPGRYVSIRPVAKQYEGKTFLGLYLGEFPVNLIVTFRPKDKRLTMMSRGNPAIFVPDLDKVVFGFESWWGEIKSPEQLKQITNEDIQNIWYVKALKQLTEQDEEDEN